MAIRAIPKRSKPATSKICVKCGKQLPLTSFHKHKDWAAQIFHDAWCRDCVQSFCKTPEKIKEYCYYNNRKYSPKQYEAAMKKAMYTLASNTDYVRWHTNPAKKEKMEMEAACRQYFTMINMLHYYVYENNVSEDGNPLNFVADGQSADPLDGSEELLYSPEWNGMYSQREIDYLNNYYAQLEDDFVLDNQNLRDYARKVSKASLDADLTYDKMRRGQVPVTAWKEAHKVFDNLSKSANFAACKRKPGENTGFGALGLIIQKIEGTGALQATKVKFPKDDVDRIIEDFRHALTAVGINEIGNPPG